MTPVLQSAFTAPVPANPAQADPASVRIHSIRRYLSLALIACSIWPAGCDSRPGGTSDELTLPQQVDIAERELDPQVRAEKLLKLSAAYRQIKDLAGGTLTTEKALEAAAEVADPAEKTRLHVAVAEEFSILGRTEQAREAAGGAQITAVSIADRKVRNELEGRIVVMLSRTGDAEASGKLMNSLEARSVELDDPADRVALFALLSATAAGAGNTVAAEKHAAEIDAAAAEIADVPARIKVLTAASGRLYRAEQPVEARKRLDAAVVLARGLTDPAVKAEALLAIFESLEDLRKTVPLAELLPDAKAATVAVTDEKQRAPLAARLQTLMNLPE